MTCYPPSAISQPGLPHPRDDGTFVEYPPTQQLGNLEAPICWPPSLVCKSLTLGAKTTKVKDVNTNDSILRWEIRFLYSKPKVTVADEKSIQLKWPVCVFVHFPEFFPHLCQNFFGAILGPAMSQLSLNLIYKIREIPFALEFSSRGRVTGPCRPLLAVGTASVFQLQPFASSSNPQILQYFF